MKMVSFHHLRTDENKVRGRAGLSAGGTFDFLKPVCSVAGQLLQGF